MSKDKDRDTEDAPSGLAGSQVDADKRRNVRAVSSSRTRSRLDSTSTSISVGEIARAVGEAHAKGAELGNRTIDTVQGALDKALEHNAEITKHNIELLKTLATVASQNVHYQLLQGQTQNRDTETHEMHETIRAGILAVGPAAAPFLAYVGRKFLPSGGDQADQGVKSPRAAAIRLFVALQDGSESSAHVLEILAMKAGDQDWPLVLSFLADLAAAPAPAEKPKGANGAKTNGAHHAS